MWLSGYEFSIATGPQHGSATYDSVTHEIIYDPEDDYVGNDSFVIEEIIPPDDEYASSDPQQWIIQASVTNGTPSAWGGFYNAVVGHEVTVDLSHKAGDPDGNPVTIYEIVDGPDHGSASLDGGTLTYTPDDGYVGGDSLTYRVKDPLTVTDGMPDGASEPVEVGFNVFDPAGVVTSNLVSVQMSGGSDELSYSTYGDQLLPTDDSILLAAQQAVANAQQQAQAAWSSRESAAWETYRSRMDSVDETLFSDNDAAAEARMQRYSSALSSYLAATESAAEDYNDAVSDADSDFVSSLLSSMGASGSGGSSSGDLSLNNILPRLQQFLADLQQADQDAITAVNAADTTLSTTERQAALGFVTSVVTEAVTYVRSLLKATGQNLISTYRAGNEYNRSMVSAETALEEGLENASEDLETESRQAHNAYVGTARSAASSFGGEAQTIADEARGRIRTAFVAYVDASNAFADYHDAAAWQEAQKALSVALAESAEQEITEIRGPLDSFVSAEQDAMEELAEKLAKAQRTFTVTTATVQKTYNDAVVTADAKYQTAISEAGEKMSRDIAAADTRFESQLITAATNLGRTALTADAGHTAALITAIRAHDLGYLSAAESLLGSSGGGGGTGGLIGGLGDFVNYTESLVNATTTRADTLATAASDYALAGFVAEQSLDGELNAADGELTEKQIQNNAKAARKRVTARATYDKSINRFNLSQVIQSTSADVGLATATAGVVRQQNEDLVDSQMTEMESSAAQAVADTTAQPSSEYLTNGNLRYSAAATLFAVDVSSLSLIPEPPASTAARPPADPEEAPAAPDWMDFFQDWLDPNGSVTAPSVSSSSTAPTANPPVDPAAVQAAMADSTFGWNEETPEVTSADVASSPLDPAERGDWPEWMRLVDELTKEPNAEAAPPPLPVAVQEWLTELATPPVPAEPPPEEPTPNAESNSTPPSSNIGEVITGPGGAAWVKFYATEPGGTQNYYYAELSAVEAQTIDSSDTAAWNQWFLDNGATGVETDWAIQRLGTISAQGLYSTQHSPGGLEYQAILQFATSILGRADVAGEFVATSSESARLSLKQVQLWGWTFAYADLTESVDSQGGNVTTYLDGPAYSINAATKTITLNSRQATDIGTTDRSAGQLANAAKAAIGDSLVTQGGTGLTGPESPVAAAAAEFMRQPVVRAAAGSVEVVGGMFMTAGGVTTAAGIVTIAHGTDQIIFAVTSYFSGRDVDPAFVQTLTAGIEAATGAEHENARCIAMISDAGVFLLFDGAQVIRAASAVNATDDAIRLGLRRTSSTPALPVLNTDFAPDAGALLQNLTNQVNARLGADISLGATVLTPEEMCAAAGNYGLFRVHYGNALERLVGNEVAGDPVLSSLFKYVQQSKTPGRKTPDFIRIGSNDEVVFDITTYQQAEKHYRRSYGDRLQLIYYERPPQYP